MSEIMECFKDTLNLKIHMQNKDTGAQFLFLILVSHRDICLKDWLLCGPFLRNGRIVCFSTLSYSPNNFEIIAM